jgi:phage tail-like protein
VPAEPTTLDAINPLSTFRFTVDIGGDKWAGVFTECSLPAIEWDVEEIKEGGRNDYIHQIIGHRKAGKVTLKHGLTKKYELMNWYAEMMDEDYKNYKKTVTITLLDSEHKPVLRWNLQNAFPIKVTWPDLKTGEAAVAIQSLELAVGHVEFEKNPS